MIVQAGDFVRSVNPFSLKLEVVMVSAVVSDGGVVSYRVTNGSDVWPTYMVRPMPIEPGVRNLK